jgi:hypothetical protein
MNSSHTDTSFKHEKEDDESDVDLTMFNSENDEFDIDLSMFDTEDDKYSDPDHCCHHIEKVSTNIQIFNIFITSLIITN